MKMDSFTSYRYADFSNFDNWDADELMAALCDLPVEVIEIHPPIEDTSLAPNHSTPSPRNTGRTTEMIHHLQAEVEKINFLYMQQAEEICFLKLRIEKMEEKQKKNINIPKKITHGQSKGLYTKRTTSQDISGSHLDHPRQIKPRRS
jgi:hypothetical protein